MVLRRFPNSHQPLCYVSRLVTFTLSYMSSDAPADPRDVVFTLVEPPLSTPEALELGLIKG